MIPSASAFRPAVSTRRSVLAWSGASLAAALGGGAWAREAPFLPFPRLDEAIPQPADFSRGRFAPLLGTDFYMEADQDGKSLACRLVDVSPHQLAGSGHSLTFVTFSLLFSCPQGLTESRIRRVSHPSLPDMELFLSPVGQTARDGTCFLEAVCSQRV